MGFVALEKIHRLYDGYRKVVAVGRERLLLLQTDGRLHLVATRCPHAGYSLEKGKVDDGCITCPRHGIVFDLDSGCAQGGELFAAVPSLTRYRVAYQGGDVGVYVD